jgi:hypothetical protein
VTARPKPTATDVSSFSCTRGEPGEDCCQRAQIPLHWCAGEFPNFGCYNDKNQFCCTDGTVCDQEDCCDLFVRVTNFTHITSINWMYRTPRLPTPGLPRLRLPPALDRRRQQAPATQSRKRQPRRQLALLMLRSRPRRALAQAQCQDRDLQWGWPLWLYFSSS